MSRLRVAVLFAGCGGSALGHALAGDEVTYADEIWRPALETFALNFPGVLVDSRDVREVEGGEFGEVDVLDASPPCQDFSAAGRHDLNGDNAWLLHEVPRIARGARPRAVVIENVTGLASEPARSLHLEVLLEELAEAGYRADWRVLDASMLRVPQQRMRLVVIGLRADLGIDPATAFPSYLARRTVMRDALPSAAALVRLPRECDRIEQVIYRRAMRFPSSQPAPTITTGGFSGGHHEMKDAYARIEEDDGSLRSVTVEDALALSGFPHDFRFPESASDAYRWRMIGNAVPPPMTEAWARSLGRALGSCG